MANQEIHNYLDEQTTPKESDFLDIDADLGSGNWLSKKLSLFNIRKWLFKLVSQDIERQVIGGLNYNVNLATNNAFELTNTQPNVNLGLVNGGGLGGTPIYNDHATFVLHIYNDSGGNIVLTNDYLQEPNNPPITTTIGGYCQVWITYHKRANNTEIFTANTINFS